MYVAIELIKKKLQPEASPWTGADFALLPREVAKQNSK